MLDIAHACAMARWLAKNPGKPLSLRFPARQSEFLKHSLVEKSSSGKLLLSYQDVTIVDTQPLDEIKY